MANRTNNAMKFFYILLILSIILLVSYFVFHNWDVIDKILQAPATKIMICIIVVLFIYLFNQALSDHKDDVSIAAVIVIIIPKQKKMIMKKIGKSPTIRLVSIKNAFFLTPR